MSPEKSKNLKSKPLKSKVRNPNEFPIVGIGASAGGLEALESFFENMPRDNGMAFVVIQHLDPTHKGIMPELLQRFSTMKVMQASDRLKVKLNTIYVIPPNKSMSILDGHLHLFVPVELRGLRLPIDIFFRSLADDQQEKSIGIILSGMGSDGSLGIKAIKEKNGIVLVQDPANARFDSMPRSAIEAIIADIIAPAGELPARLISFLAYTPVKQDSDLQDKPKNNIEKVIILLREQTGHDFSFYKKNTLLRRIERRMGIHQLDKINNYVRFLQENPKENEILFKEMLIGVTSFFRDRTVWDKLKEEFLPKLLDEFPDGYVLRAWVAGCSTGEEAYTLAIVLKEVYEQSFPRKKITTQIFATDLDQDAIKIARVGLYPLNISNDVSPERLDRFFTLRSEGYQVNSNIRDMVVFAVQNVIKDPPFTKLDLVTCRNLLIYLEPVLQKKLLGLFHYSLNPGGLLLLGTAETLGNKNESFDVLDNRYKFFKRNTTRTLPEFLDFPSSFSRKKPDIAIPKIQQKAVDNIQTLADQILLQRFAPASVLVNNRGDILYITGHTGKYLEPVAGKANWNIHVMAREGLRQELPTAFRKAAQHIEPVILHVKIGTNGGSILVDVTIQCLETPDILGGMFMIVFTDIHVKVEDEAPDPKSRKRRLTLNQKEMEIKLNRSYEDLQSLREEMQTSQEELKSTNEELQSTNEELQSTNEELTTSKEEMQSLNEELQTVNIELQTKVNEFIKANDDMKNLLNSTEIATLFLDKDLNVRRFTDHVTKIVKLRNVDIGRPFTELVNDLQYPEIGMHARQVIKTLVSNEQCIATKDGRWFTVRIMPYRTLDDKINGLVITFIDITIAKKLELELKKANDAIYNKKTE